MPPVNYCIFLSLVSIKLSRIKSNLFYPLLFHHHTDIIENAYRPRRAGAEARPGLTTNFEM